MSETFASAGPATYYALAAMILTGACVIIQALCGFINGTHRQILKTVLTLAAAVIAFFIVNSLCDKVFSSLEGTTLEEFLAAIESSASEELAPSVKEVILGLNPLTLEYLGAVVFSPLCAPFIFFPVFFILNIFFRIAYYIIKAFLKNKNKKSFTGRLVGAVLGAAHGLVFAFILLLPFTVVNDTLNVIVEGKIESAESTADAEELTEIYEKDILPVTNHSVFQTVKLLGGEAVLDAFGNVKNSEAEFNAREEYYLIIKTIAPDIQTLSEIKFESLSEEDKAAIENLISLIDVSELTCTAVTEILNAAGDVLKDNPAVDTANTRELIVALADIFSTATEKTVSSDLSTLADVFFILSDSGFTDPPEGSDPADILTKKDENGVTVLDRVLGIIDSNPRFSVVETALVKTSLKILAAEGTPVTPETYDNVKGSINGIVTMEKPSKDDSEAYSVYLSNVSDKIDETLKTEGITLEKEIIDGMAEYVAENYGGASAELTDGQFNDIMLNYYDEYVKYTEKDAPAAQ